MSERVPVNFGSEDCLWLLLKPGDTIAVTTPFIISILDDISGSFKVLHTSDRQCLLEYLGSRNWAEIKFNGFVANKKRSLWCKDEEVEDDEDGIEYFAQEENFEQMQQNPMIATFCEYIGSWKIFKGLADVSATISIQNRVNEHDGSVKTVITLPNMSEGPVTFGISGRELIIVKCPSLSAEFAMPLRGLLLVGIISGNPVCFIRETPTKSANYMRFLVEFSTWPLKMEYSSFISYLPQNETALLDMAGVMSTEYNTETFIRLNLVKSGLMNNIQRNKILSLADTDLDAVDQGNIMRKILSEIALTDLSSGLVLKQIIEETITFNARVLFLELQMKTNLRRVLEMERGEDIARFKRRVEFNQQSCPFDPTSTSHGSSLRPDTTTAFAQSELKSTVISTTTAKKKNSLSFSHDDSDYVDQLLRRRK